MKTKKVIKKVKKFVKPVKKARYSRMNKGKMPAKKSSMPIIDPKAPGMDALSAE